MRECVDVEPINRFIKVNELPCTVSQRITSDTCVTSISFEERCMQSIHVYKSPYVIEASSEDGKVFRTDGRSWYVFSGHRSIYVAEHFKTYQEAIEAALTKFASGLNVKLTNVLRLINNLNQEIE